MTSKLILSIAFQSILLVLAAASSTEEFEFKGGEYARTLDKSHLGLGRKEVLTHLRLYWQDSLTGPNPTAARLHEAFSNASLFGQATIMDDPLTTGVSTKSPEVGRAQGTYTVASRGEIVSMMIMNFVFKTGKYNGSSIAIFGKNRAIEKVREMPIVGGSGVFRFARGYVELRTIFADYVAFLATVQYDCYILHY